MKNKAYPEFEKLAQLAKKNYPKSMLADYQMGQMYEKKGETAKAVKSYMMAYQREEIGDLTKDMMIERADELKNGKNDPAVEETLPDAAPTDTPPTEEKKQE